MTSRGSGSSSSPPQRGGEVARAKPEAERGSAVSSRRSQENIARARKLRQGGNMPEALLWDELKARKLGGYKFVRQMPLGPYFADFACRSQKLVVELDGSQHIDSRYDRRRDELMREHEYSVLRFWSHDALQQMRSVCETILAALEGRLSDEVVTAGLRFVFASRSGGAR